MSDAGQKFNPGEDPSLAMDILILYDDFAEFNNNCAFLCHAIFCVISADLELDKHVIEGMTEFAHQIKRRSAELKEQVSRLHEKSREAKLKH